MLLGVLFVAVLWSMPSRGQEMLSPEMQVRVQRKNGMTPQQLAEYLPYIYPRVERPVAEGVCLSVPPQPANRTLAEMGVLDVTVAPFGADRSGLKDATRAIQDAVNFARDRQMVLFFPAGTYRISDTIECRQKLGPPRSSPWTKPLCLCPRSRRSALAVRIFQRRCRANQAVCLR